MSVTIEFPRPDSTLTAADGEVAGDGLVITVRGQGPRSAPVFVNETVTETDESGAFTCETTLPAGEAAVIAGMLTGCACVTSRFAVTVEL